MSAPDLVTPGDAGAQGGSLASGGSETPTTASPVDEPQVPAAPGRVRRAHRFLVPTLFVLATLSLFGGAFAVWVNRQALNTDNWARRAGSC